MYTERITQSLKDGVKLGLCTQIDTAFYYILYQAHKDIDCPLILITKSDSEARKISDELGAFFDCNIYWYPKQQFTFHDLEAESSDVRAFRMQAINAIINEDKPVIVTTLEGLCSPLTPKEDFHISTYRVGDVIDVDAFKSTVTDIGYESVSVVDGRCQFSVRGGIIDIFPPYLDSPVRIELFDDEIDSIRHFDVLTQRSLENVEEFNVLPATEFIIPQNKADHICQLLRNDLFACSKGLSPKSREKLQNRVSAITARLESGVVSSHYKNYLPYIYEKRTIISDYCADCRFAVIEPDSVYADYELFLTGCNQRFTDMLENGEVLPNQLNIVPSLEEMEDMVNAHPWICVKEFLSQFRYLVPEDIISEQVTPTLLYSGNFDELLDDIKKYRTSPCDIFMFTGNEKRALLLKQYFNGNGIYPVTVANLSEAQSHIENSQKNGTASPLFIVKTHLSRGCVFGDKIFIGDNEIFGSAKKASHSRHASANSKPIKSFTELTIGSYVVHETHGIAKFTGIKANEISGKKQDYLCLEYAGGDTIYVPVDRLDFIQPYISTGGDAAPTLSRLGGREWGNAKEKASTSIKKLAYNLVELYARRQVYKGFKYSPDTVWQRELEDSFIYEETEDQLKAIEEIKRDMEDYKIMDRLLCGDVGFGKTEVAVRAAFKAIMDGKQVALLAPTTILAQQHFQTFKERYEHFPVKVDVVSRFRTPQEQKKTLDALALGEVDMLIGTHRILSKDVKFKDLGLLIIDEEQRFGVNHKEKIKDIKKSVDVLTLSATPIPRTLHMSLVGIRDISIIDTPPRDRYPVQTYVIEDNDDIVRGAILRELDRNGQVFFLYNNVQNIDKFKLKLSALVPEARIAVAHGQMSESQLEKVMMSYFEHEYDVLLCSTIIESGIDVPNANTLFVYDADKLGLSQLYQIRGRIGRSTRVAYAYLMYREDKVLSDVATKRLKAIKDFTDLGSGFRIAMKDLEIRGAGNVIGSEQSGHMTNIGYDLYCKMLSDEIASLQGKTSDEQIEVTINIQQDAYIPSTYITEESIRLEMYKKISLIDSLQDKYDVEEEIEDRYSNMPKEITNLTNCAYIRSICRRAKICQVKQKGDKYELGFVKGCFNPQSFGEIAPHHKVSVELNLKGNPTMTLGLQDVKPGYRLGELAAVMQEIFDKGTGEEE